LSLEIVKTSSSGAASNVSPESKGSLKVEGEASHTLPSRTPSNAYWFGLKNW
jgi:hypothetical protein